MLAASGCNAKAHCPAMAFGMLWRRHNDPSVAVLRGSLRKWLRALLRWPVLASALRHVWRNDSLNEIMARGPHVADGLKSKARSVAPLLC